MRLPVPVASARHLHLPPEVCGLPPVRGVRRSPVGLPPIRIHWPSVGVHSERSSDEYWNTSTVRSSQVVAIAVFVHQCRNLRGSSVHRPRHAVTNRVNTSGTALSVHRFLPLRSVCKSRKAFGASLSKAARDGCAVDRRASSGGGRSCSGRDPSPCNRLPTASWLLGQRQNQIRQARYRSESCKVGGSENLFSGSGCR